jgi:hypothetical protein
MSAYRALNVKLMSTCAISVASKVRLAFFPYSKCALKLMNTSMKSTRRLSPPIVTERSINLRPLPFLEGAIQRATSWLTPAYQQVPTRNPDTVPSLRGFEHPENGVEQIPLTKKKRYCSCLELEHNGLNSNVQCCSCNYHVWSGARCGFISRIGHTCQNGVSRGEFYCTHHQTLFTMKRKRSTE